MPVLLWLGMLHVMRAEAAAVRLFVMLVALSTMTAGLSACQTPPLTPSPTGETTARAFDDLAPIPGERRYVIDPDASELLIFVFRAGRAARLGHNHVLRAKALDGVASLVDERPDKSRFAVNLRLDQLAVDPPELRRRIGATFAGTRSDADIAGTRNNMLKSLDAERFATVSVRSLAVSGDWPWLVATFELTLHGVTRELRAPLHVTHDATRLDVNGRFAIAQSDFGIQAYSVLGGLMSVSDTVLVDFTLHARAAAD